MAANDASHHFGRLHGQFQPIRIGGSQGLDRLPIRMERVDVDIEPSQSRHVEQLLGQLYGMKMGVIFTQGDQTAIKSGVCFSVGGRKWRWFLGPGWPSSADLRPNQGISAAQQNLGAGMKL